MGIQPFKKSKEEELKEHVISLYQSGLSFRGVSKRLGISHETVRKIWLSTQVQDVA